MPAHRRFSWQRPDIQPWLALITILLLALALRLPGLGDRAPWMDEVASTIFNLGNSSRNTPINEVVDLDTFLRPLQWSGHFSPGEVMKHLFAEDNHPPLYFVLAHGWIRLFHSNPGLADIGLNRLFPALLGVAAVPISAWLGQTAIGTRRGGLIAAFWMAVSPLALAQSLEIRQYSLGILLSTASLLCFVKAWQRQRNGQKLPMAWMVSWIAINAAGLACHYFFVLGILMQTLSAGIVLRHNRRSWVALLLSLSLGMAWLPTIAGFSGSQQSSWLRMSTNEPLQRLAIPIQSALGALFSGLAPGTYAVHPWQWPLLIACGIATLTGVILLVLMSRNNPQDRFVGSSSSEATRRAGTMLATTLLCGLAIQTALSLILMSDFTKGYRYSFFIIPVATTWLATICENQLSSQRPSPRRRSLALMGCGLICALGVTGGSVLPKWYNSELLIKKIAQESQQSILIAHDLGTIGRQPKVIGIDPLSIAWWIGSHRDKSRTSSTITPRFLLTANTGSPAAADTLRMTTKTTIAQLHEPIDLWVIDSSADSFLNPTCRLISQGSEGSHLYAHYNCNNSTGPG